MNATSPCPLQLRSRISAQGRAGSLSYIPIGILINLDVCMSRSLFSLRTCVRTEKEGIPFGAGRGASPRCISTQLCSISIALTACAQACAVAVRALSQPALIPASKRSGCPLDSFYSAHWSCIQTNYNGPSTSPDFLLCLLAHLVLLVESRAYCTGSKKPSNSYHGDCWSWVSAPITCSSLCLPS